MQFTPFLTGLPPEKWSSLKYGLWPDGGLKNAEEETQGRRDCREVAAGWGVEWPRPVGGWGDPIDRGYGGSSAMNCSTEKSSTRWKKPGWSSSVGGGTTTRFDRTHRSATNHRPQRLYNGRLRNPGQLRRPPQP